MSMNERIYMIDHFLANRRFITFDELMTRLEVSRATLKRDLAYMRDRLNAPIIFDRELGGYRFDQSSDHVGEHYELPGLWFSAEEIHALLTMQHLLSTLDTGGLLGPHIQPLLARLTGILGTSAVETAEISKRIKMENIGVRHFHLEHFQAIGSALLRRKRIQIEYHAKGYDETTEREISPQRLMYYRGNWYLDAWCHLRKALRSFAVDSIQRVEILEKNVIEVAEKKLDDTLGSGYGIFSGRDVTWAVLRFTKERSRWVAGEYWHPKQKSRFLPDGSYELSFPYSDDRELVMDILKYGAEVKVLKPDALIQKVKEQAERLAKVYAEQ
jgi:predicted DNA-binding transcriptional regulator YafY